MDGWGVGSDADQRGVRLVVACRHDDEVGALFPQRDRVAAPVVGRPARLLASGRVGDGDDDSGRPWPSTRRTVPTTPGPDSGAAASCSLWVPP